MGMFSGDLLESANAVIKDMHNNYSNRARGKGAKTNIGEALLRVVQQCQARIILGNELPRWEGRTKGHVVHVAVQRESHVVRYGVTLPPASILEVHVQYLGTGGKLWFNFRSTFLQR